EAIPPFALQLFDPRRCVFCPQLPGGGGTAGGERRPEVAPPANATLLRVGGGGVRGGGAAEGRRRPPRRDLSLATVAWPGGGSGPTWTGGRRTTWRCCVGMSPGFPPAPGPQGLPGLPDFRRPSVTGSGPAGSIPGSCRSWSSSSNAPSIATTAAPTPKQSGTAPAPWSAKRDPPEQRPRRPDRRPRPGDPPQQRSRVSGYNHKVGSKTGLSFVNSNILHLCARRPGCFCHPYGESVPIVMYICQPVHFLDYAVCNSSHKAPLLITDVRFDMLCARIVKYYSLKTFVDTTGKPPGEWTKVHDEKMFHYSSGMQAVMLALGICDQVSVFGFGKSAEAKHHYHTNQKAELDLHDYEAEYALYRDLVEQPQ
ncbi:unnamed protein product, partial [Musa acuminata subsp. malaccensis]